MQLGTEVGVVQAQHAPDEVFFAWRERVESGVQLTTLGGTVDLQQDGAQLPCTARTVAGFDVRLVVVAAQRPLGEGVGLEPTL
ncbi:hypothetical protein D3C85_1465620 [compost metagenome]